MVFIFMMEKRRDKLQVSYAVFFLSVDKCHKESAILHFTSLHAANIPSPPGTLAELKEL